MATVCCDHERGGRELVDRLVKAGHRNFVILSGPPESEVSTLRTRGAIGAIERIGGLTCQLLEGDYTYKCGRERADQIVAMKPTFAPNVISQARAFFEEVLNVRARVDNIGNSSIIFEFAAFKARNDELVATGKIVAVVINPQTKKSVRVPDAFRQAVGKYENS